jgi:hypothetical protein
LAANLPETLRFYPEPLFTWINAGIFKHGLKKQIRSEAMDRAKRLLFAVGVLTALAATDSASAQPTVSLTGTYKCVQGCVPGFEGKPAFVTQNGWNINIVTESGVPVQASLDWFSPTTRIWMETLHQGAVYSADGLTIQFDRGTVWQRDPGPDHAVIASCARRFRSYDPDSQTYLGRDGRRHSCP